jgi:hypothetical protein
MAAAPELRGMSETSAAIEIGRISGVGKNTVLRALGKGMTDEREAGDLRLDTLVRLANFFGIGAEDLLRDHSRPMSMRGRVITTRAHNKHNDRARTEGKDAEDRASLHRRRRA